MNLLIHSGGSDWFLHQVVSAIIHSAIYAMAYHVFKDLSLTGALVAGGVILLTSWVVYKMFSQARG